MAQSIRKQLNEGQVEVEHKGQKDMFDLPEWLQLSNDVLDSEEKLIEHLREQGLLLAVLHQGLSQSVIGVRAVARPNVTKSDPDPAFPTAALRKRAASWKPNRLPSEDGGRLSKRDKAIKALTDLGFTQAQAEAAVDNVAK